AVLLSVLIGVSLGLLGGGGSILTVPILVHALGVAEKAAIATSLLVVGVTSAVAAAQHARANNVVWRVAMVFAPAGMLGAFVAGLIARFLPASLLLLLFALMMGITGVFMWRGCRVPAQPRPQLGQLGQFGQPAQPGQPGQLGRFGKIFREGLLVGLVTGLVGAGGGFLVVPALVLLGGLPMRLAVGTSLVVISLKSFAGFAGYISHVDIDWTLAAIVTGAAVIGSFAGAALGRKVAPESLRRGFALFVLGMAVYLLWKQIA
ncbi:MAG TPA: sulfite exporter TauE/SafE family protein, partial [Haliangium sp.]|nr:sulfite exporter TauE/SafE family protein [Haliangium sp.]